MAGFLGGGAPKTQVTVYSGLQIQSTSSALPIPVGWGKNILTPNCVYYDDFQAHANSSKSAGGKGGGGRATSYTYSATLVLALCEGPVSGIENVWQASPTPVTLATTGLTLFEGAAGQGAWSYLATNHPDKALAYPHTAYLCAANYNLGSSASINSNTYEVEFPLMGTGCNGVDADPAQIVYDFLTNPRYGVGFPAGSIDLGSLYGGTNTSSYQCYCWAAGIALSPVLNNQESASSILARWLQLTNSTAVWSGGLLKFIPLGDMDLTGNSKTWLANDAPLYDLTDDDFLAADGEDPVKITRSDPFAAYNRQSVEIQSRDDDYNTGPVEAFDQAAIDRFGSRIGSSVTAHEICDLSIAQTVAQLILQRGLYVRNTYTFSLSLEFSHLDPMDLVTLTDPAIGLNKTVVRITDIEEDDDGNLTVTAEEFPQGVQTASKYAVQSKVSTAPNNQVAPGSINPPIIFEPPGSLAGALEVWVVGSGVEPQNWGGAHVWASYDGATYSQIGTIQPGAQGVLTAPLAAVATTAGGPTIDTANTLSVSLAESGGALQSTSQTGAQQGATLCFVGGELLAYENAALTGTNAYNLSYLVRGLYGTQASVGAHATGAQFGRVDGNVFKYGYSNYQIGATVYLKFTSFNIYGAAEESLADVAVYTHTLGGSPTPSAVTILTGALTQAPGGVSLTLDATWTADPLAVTYIAEISTDTGVTWRTIYNAADTALDVGGLGQQNLVFRVAGVNANGIRGAWATIGIVSPVINYAAAHTAAYIGYDQLATLPAQLIAFSQFDSLDDTTLAQIGTILDQSKKTATLQAQAAAAQAGVTQTSQAVAALTGSFASYQTTVSASFSNVNAQISNEATTRASADQALANQILAVSASTSVGTAQGKLEITAASGLSGVSAAIQLGVSATANGVGASYAGAYILAMSDGTSRFVINATNFYVLGANTTVFGTNADGSLSLNGVTRVNSTIESAATTASGTPKMRLDFVNGILQIARS